MGFRENVEVLLSRSHRSQCDLGLHLIPQSIAEAI
jgi:hypothetical protein